MFLFLVPVLYVAIFSSRKAHADASVGEEHLKDENQPVLASLRDRPVILLFIDIDGFLRFF